MSHGGPARRTRTPGSRAPGSRPLFPLLLSLVLPLACGESAEEGVRPEGRPPRGGTAVVGVSSAPTTPFPPLARTSLDLELAGLLYPGLNHAVWEEGGLAFREEHPLALSEGWRFGPEGLSLTYRLDPGRRWSDGRPVSAADVAFTFRLLADPEAALPLSYVTAKLDTVVVRGEAEVTFRFRRRYPGMLFDTGVGILPARHFAGTDPSGWGGHPGLRGPAGDSIAFAGPFRLAEWRPEDRIVLIRNPVSPVSPRLDTLVLRVLPEETTRLAELRAGGLEMAEVGSFRQARELAAGGRFRVETVPGRAYDYIAWNPGGHPAFGDPRVREALSLAIDRREMIGALDMEDFAVPARGPYGPLFPELVPDSNTARHDPVRARALLERAGWRLREEDGVRRKGEHGLAFELAVPAESDRRSDAAEMIQAQLARLGVRAEIREQEFRSLFARVLERDYEAALLGWQVGLDPDISPFWRDPEARLNVVGYADSAAAALIDSALAAPTVREAAPHWRRAAERIAADYPYAFLWYFDLVVAVAPRLRGVDPSPLGLTRGAHEWWVEPE